MSIFDLTDRPNDELFFRRDDANDVRLGEIVPNEKYENAEIVILGFPCDEGVARNNGRIGAALAPDEIRRQFYKLTPFGIKTKIFDLGNTKMQATLEESHEAHTEIVAQVLRAGKKIITVGGGNDLSFADGCAMAQVFGQEWIASNIDAHFDVRNDNLRNSGTPYRQLLDGGFLKPAHFYEVAYQPQVNSPIYYNYLRRLGVTCISLDQLRADESTDSQLRELVRQQFIRRSSTLNSFFGFDLDAVRAADCPGVSAPSPIGLTAEEFLKLVKFAASLSTTKLIEFTEVNPKFDIDNRTTKLVAIAMHVFCSGLK